MQDQPPARPAPAAAGLADALAQPGAGAVLQTALAARFGRVGHRVDLPGSGLRRVAVTRDSPSTTARMRRGALLADQVTVGSRFAGPVVRYLVLGQRSRPGGWRLVLLCSVRATRRCGWLRRS